MNENPFIAPFQIEDDPVDAFYILKKVFKKTYWIEPVMGRPISNHNILYDWFHFLDTRIIRKLQNKSMFLIYNFRNEGYSGTGFRIFDELYNCLRYDIPPSQIVLISSNLKNTQTLEHYLSQKNYDPIRTFDFPFFERNINVFFENRVNYTPLQWMKNMERQVNTYYKGKHYFCSLSRASRHERAVGTFLLCQTPLKEHALISHDVLVDPILAETIDYFVDQNKKKMIKPFRKWVNTLPLIADRTDFDNNWAMGEYDFLKLFNSVLFQLVNETWVRDWNGTSLFYSEKTFKSMLTFQPFLIWGQPGANYALKDLGYKTYEDWFDLSFDNEPDEIERYKKILQSVGKAVEEIKSMSLKDQIRWRFKNMDVLMHNYEHLSKEGGTQHMLTQFINKLG